jgi:ribosome-associated protein
MEIDTKDLIENLTSLLDAEKAEDIIYMDLTGKSAISDYIIVATALNKKHAQALADKICLHMKNEHRIITPTEGTETGEWILVDCFDIVVHILLKATRDNYRIEDLWKCKPNSVN